VVGELYRSPHHDNIPQEEPLLSAGKIPVQVGKFKAYESAMARLFSSPLLFQLPLQRTTQLFVLLPRLPSGPQPRGRCSLRPGTLLCRTGTDLVNIRCILRDNPCPRRADPRLRGLDPKAKGPGRAQGFTAESRVCKLHLDGHGVRKGSRDPCSEGAPAGAAAPRRTRILFRARQAICSASLQQLTFGGRKEHLPQLIFPRDQRHFHTSEATPPALQLNVRNLTRF